MAIFNSELLVITRGYYNWVPNGDPFRHFKIFKVLLVIASHFYNFAWVLNTVYYMVASTA